MTQSMSLREVVAHHVKEAVLSASVDVPAEFAERVKMREMISASTTNAILSVLASGSHDHAELARLAEAANADNPSPWVINPRERTLTGNEPQCVYDAEGSWVANCDSGAVDAFIVAADPVGVLGLIAENAVLRSERDRAEERIRDLAAMFGVCDGGRYLNDWKARCDRATEAARKLAEADREIAALRGGMRSLEIRRDFYKHNMQRAEDRVAEAERKLAEARGLLREWLDTMAVAPSGRNAIDIATDTDTFLSSTEAERG